MRNSRFYLSCAMLIAIGQPVYGSEGMINLVPYVSSDVTLDDNVFRFESKRAAFATFGSDKLSDVIKRLELGMNATLRLGRQRLTLSSNVAESRYDNFDILDNQSKSSNAVWNWQLGNHLTGDFAYSTSEGMVGFSEIRNAVQNIRNSETKRASINYLFHPSWSVSASYTDRGFENNTLSLSTGDRSDVTEQVGLTYRNAADNSAELLLIQVRTEFPNRESSLFGDHNEQKTARINLGWNASGKTRLTGSLYKTEVHYPQFSERDVEGWNQRFGINYSWSEKTRIGFSMYEEISPVEDLFSTFIKVKGTNLTPSWQLTSKVSLSGQLGWERREYLGDASVFAAVAIDTREDIARTTSLSLVYAPRINTSVRLQYSGEDRTSDIAGRSYKFQSLNCQIRYDWN